MTSIYRADDAATYEQAMGRWSQRLARLFVPFAQVAGASRIADIGCGTGSLLFALAETVPDARITGFDHSSAFLAYATAKAAGDARLTFDQGDAVALPYADGTFDATLSQLALNFVPEAHQAAREMVRVTRPGGIVAAAVWDFRGGMTFLRMFTDTAAPLDPGASAFRAHQFAQAFTGSGELAACWSAMGLRDVEQVALTIRVEFADFADYWEPWLGGQGTIGSYVAGLSETKRAEIAHHLRLAYLSGGEDGPRSFAATAWACRGVR